MCDLLTIKQASEFASEYLNKNVTTSNISYLIQYGRIKKIGNNNEVRIAKQELVKYYESYHGKRETEWKNQLGEDLNWFLSFEQFKEAETTKHVHRLHPYKGKFIPQLVEYFLDEHTDKFKKEAFFNKGDIILDPFCGSGTALVQANELGLHAIGIDISAFNALISNVKVDKYDFTDLHNEIQNITIALTRFVTASKVFYFEKKLLSELAKFNNKFFPVPEYKYRLRKGEINEEDYGYEKEKEFLPIFQELVKENDIKLKQEEENNNFLDKWYLKPVRDEIDFVFELLKKIENKKTKKVASIILSRTIRTCRATTHSDLATLKEPISSIYYCSKHGKICKPLFSILSWWKRYSIDTLDRLKQFDNLRTDTNQICLAGDARTIDLVKELEKRKPDFAELVKNKKIKGIFSSPPYVGLINYHEQHAYAYDLFGFERKDELEIGSLSNGNGKEARNSYIQGISQALNNCKRFLVKDYDVFIVANDKYDIYPKIVEKSGMRIFNQYKRPVLNRTEKDRGAYSEKIFHLKDK